MKKILITGANSYIGTSFEKYLKKWKDEYQVDTVDMIDGSWRDKNFADYDTVFHVAGIESTDIIVVVPAHRVKPWLCKPDQHVTAFWPAVNHVANAEQSVGFRVETDQIQGAL